jgi:adenylate cyclase
MKKHIDGIKRLFAASRGRPMALGILIVLGSLNLLSNQVEPEKPSWLDTVQGMATGGYKTARRLLFDQYQVTFPRKPLSQPVTIVAIDEPSLAAVGQWPWPRNKLANLIDAINAQKPLAIGLDIYMPERDQTSPDQVAKNLPPNAAALATALKNLPTHETILASALTRSPSILGVAAFDHAAQTTTDRLVTKPIVVKRLDAPSTEDGLRHTQRFERVLASLPELQSAAQGQALLSVPLDNGVVRRIPLVMRLGETVVPSLALEMLRVATDTSAIEVLTDARGLREVQVADLRISTQEDAEIWLHAAPIKTTIGRYVSALDLLQGKANPEQFENKLILLGLTGAGLNDMRTTPLGELVPGIEIQAQVIESIIDQNLLRRPHWLVWSEALVIGLFGALLIWYIPRPKSGVMRLLRRYPKSAGAIGIGLNLLLVGVGFALFNFYGLLADTASSFLVLSAVMGSLLTSALSHIEKEKTSSTQNAVT